MRNTDYNLGKEYELKIMSSLELKNLLMKDNNLTEEDILFHFSLNSFSTVKVKYTSYTGREHTVDKYDHLFKNLLKSYMYYNKGLKENTPVKYPSGLIPIEEACKELGIEKEPYLDANGVTYNDFIKEFSSKFLCYSELKYDTCDYETALNETLEYNMKLFNVDRGIPNETFNQGIENSSIVINQREDGRYELIDGFYRILYKNIDRNVIVKIYKNLSDEEWFKLMINCNYWKTNVSSNLFYDRGFLLGLKCRYGVNMEDYLSENRYWNEYNGLIDLLTAIIKPIYYSNYKDIRKAMEDKDISDYANRFYRGTDINELRNNVLTNKFFISDLKMFKNYINYLPANLLKLKKLENVDVYKTYAYKKFFDNILKLVLSYRLVFADREMNELPVDLIDIIFNDKEIKASYLKAISMTVPGFVDNRLDLLYANLIPIFDELLLK